MNLVELSVRICIDQFTQLTALIALTNLTDLTLELDGRNPDLGQLAPMTNLRKLRIKSGKPLDLQSVSTLTQLSHLDLSQSIINDITPIVNLTNLTCLKLKPGHGFDLKIFQKRDGLRIEETEFADRNTLLAQLFGLERSLDDLRVLSRNR